MKFKKVCATVQDSTGKHCPKKADFPLGNDEWLCLNCYKTYLSKSGEEKIDKLKYAIVGLLIDFPTKIIDQVNAIENFIKSGTAKEYLDEKYPELPLPSVCNKCKNVFRSDGIHIDCNKETEWKNFKAMEQYI